MPLSRLPLQQHLADLPINLERSCATSFSVACLDLDLNRVFAPLYLKGLPSSERALSRRVPEPAVKQQRFG